MPRYADDEYLLITFITIFFPLLAGMQWDETEYSEGLGRGILLALVMDKVFRFVYWKCSL